MEYHNIRNMINSSINYSVYQIKNLNKDTKEMLVGNIMMKVTNDPSIERMLTTEKINILLKVLNTNTDLKKTIVSEIKNMNIIHVFSAIKKEGDNSFRSISKHFDELKPLADKHFDIEYSEKYIMILIQSLLKTMTQGQVKSIITNVKNIMEMIGGFEKSEDEQDEEKIVIDVEKSITLFLKDNNFDAKEEGALNYINNINMEELNTILKQCEDCDYDCLGFFDRLFTPYITNLSGDRTQYISDDIFLQFLKQCDMNDYIVIQLEEFIAHSENIKTVISKHKYGIARDYITLLKSHMDMSEYENQMKTIIEKSQITSVLAEQIKEYSKYINTSGLNKFKKTQLEKMMDMMKTAGKAKLGNFIRQTLYEDKTVMTDLESIGILTYHQLEQIVVSNKFIKMCRGVKKVLSGKVIRNIIYHIFDNHGKLNVTKKEMIKEDTIINMKEISEINFDASFLSTTCTQEETQDIRHLKSKRMNLSNFRNIMEEQECDVSDINEELKELDNKINQHYLGMNGDKACEAIMENVAELHDYIRQVKDEKETENITAVINYYTELTRGAADIYKIPFQKLDEKTTKTNTINGALDNIINKYNKEFTKVEKSENKQKFNSDQTKMIERIINSVLNTFDNKYNTKMSINSQRITTFVKHNLNSLIKPELYKGDVKNKFVMQGLVNNTVSLFCVIFCLMNGDIDLKSVYEDISSINDNMEKMGKTVLVKSMDTQGIFKGEYYNTVYVDFGDRVELVESSDIIFVNSFMGKNVIVIKGNHKSVIGTVYNETMTHVLMTKDIYGKVGTLSISTLKSIKVLKDDVKLYKCQYKSTSMQLVDTDIVGFFKTKPEDIFPLAKYYYYRNINTTSSEHFPAMYSTALKMFNKIKKEEIALFNTCKSLKTQFEDAKKLALEYKKNKNKKFISQKKEVFQLKRDFMDAIKVVKMVGNKKNLYLKKNDIKKGQVEYSLEDNIYSIVDNSYKYMNKYSIDNSEDHKTFRKKAVSAKQKRSTMNKAITISTDLLANLLA